MLEKVDAHPVTKVALGTLDGQGKDHRGGKLLLKRQQLIHGGVACGIGSSGSGGGGDGGGGGGGGGGLGGEFCGRVMVSRGCGGGGVM